MRKWILGLLWGVPFAACYVIMLAAIYLGVLMLTDVFALDGLVRWLLLVLGLVPVIVLSTMSVRYLRPVPSPSPLDATPAPASVHADDRLPQATDP